MQDEEPHITLHYMHLPGAEKSILWQFFFIALYFLSHISDLTKQ